MKAAMRSRRDYLLAYGRRLDSGPSTPTSGFATKLDALIVLVAGDLAVLAWWAAIFCWFIIALSGDGLWLDQA